MKHPKEKSLRQTAYCIITFITTNNHQKVHQENKNEFRQRATVKRSGIEGKNKKKKTRSKSLIMFDVSFIWYVMKCDMNNVFN